MFNKLPLSDTQNWNHWIADTSSSKAVYNTWLHIAEKFVLKKDFKTWRYECRYPGGLPYWNVIVRWAATVAFRTEMVKYSVHGSMNHNDGKIKVALRPNLEMNANVSTRFYGP